MALLRFSPEFASIVQRKESILSEKALKLRANHENGASARKMRSSP
jgi:hypothetical protein